MVYVTVGSLVIGVLGLAFGLRCYRELWKWARQCQRARIALSYKGKVKLNAPLVEWLTWCNQLDKDKDSNGRVVYTFGGTAVAILKKSPASHSGSTQARNLVKRLLRVTSKTTGEPK